VKRRIESTTSRTAEMTCISRAMSSLETNNCYRSDDHIAVLLLPNFFRFLVRVPLFRMLFSRKVAPKGMYEYVIARSKYIESIFKHALAERFGQIVIFGAGFDTRALRFKDTAGEIRIFELDISATQNAKIGQYLKRGLEMPENLIFVPIDFDKESLSAKLEEVGFDRHKRSLFILEGVLMYLQPESANKTFRTMQEFAGMRSEVVFDYIYSSVLLSESHSDAEREIVRTVSKAGEQWHFGIGKGKVENFLTDYGFELIEHLNSHQLEQA